MLHRLTLAALALPLVLAGAAWSRSSAGSVTVTTFAISGHGWGHGVGMAQWGALGQAKRGVPYDRILAHYYPGTKLGEAPTPTIRVLLSEGTARVKVRSASRFTVKDGAGALHRLAAGTYAIGVRFAVKVNPAKPARRLPGPLTLRRGASPLQVGGSAYRGQIQLQVVAGKLQAVNVVGLDPYVLGVVTQEMPKDWPLEALKAQAVAARSFALSMRQDGHVLYADTRGQVYGGISAETPASEAAVEATRGQVLLYGGKVATTFFYSSSGGRTASINDLEPNAKPVPYLVSVDDPDDSVSPFHDWGPVVFAGAQVSKLLGVPGADDLRTVPDTGRAREVVVVNAHDREMTLTAQTVRFALGLRSTWFRAGVLSLSGPVAAVAPGKAVTLTGVARRLPGPYRLERRNGQGPWAPGYAVTPSHDGSFSVEVKPEATTSYRLSAGTIKTSPVRLSVSRAHAATRKIAGSRASSGRLTPAVSAFTTDDPLVPLQWYLARDRAFDLWPELPVLQPVRVAVIDTGIDLGHPEFAGRIVAKKSFVGHKVYDKIGHGTFVAGVIGAAAGNGQGVAGIAFPAELIVAKVVGSDGTIDPEVEARAIRWAVDEGARVINLSLGGLRDPANPRRDTFSPAERSAIEYAYGQGVVVVAAVGNGDQAPSSPWRYASYPSALPHVIGVSAVTQAGSVPAFSNRDAVFNDVAAPGESIVSTLPRQLTEEEDPLCADQGYSICGPVGYRHASGTSFAAPQVSAAAALLLAVRPDLTPDQVTALIERTAVDADASSGCRRCAVGRDALSGWGRLDIAAALQSLEGTLPPRDHLETNDDAGELAPRLWGRAIAVKATIDFWDDQIDVYRVKLRVGERVSAALQGPVDTDMSLVLWKPGTQHVESLTDELQKQRATQSTSIGPNQSFRYRAHKSGWYFIEVKAAGSGSGEYTLRIAKSV
jgi:stage II sporulation protein D